MDKSMTQEDRKLLFEDLSSRLPYGVMVQHPDLFYPSKTVIEKLTGIDNERVNDDGIPVEYVKPYLRKPSSMSYAEMDKLFEILNVDKTGMKEDWIRINDSLGIKFFLPSGRYMEDVNRALNYLRSIHIDINEMIEKELAYEAPEGMYHF